MRHSTDSNMQDGGGHDYEIDKIEKEIAYLKMEILALQTTDAGTIKWRLEEFLKFIGKNNWFVEEDGTVWENAFMEGYQVDAIKQFLGDESSNAERRFTNESYYVVASHNEKTIENILRMVRENKEFAQAVINALNI